MERILVVDDSIPFLKDIEVLLKKNYAVTTAHNGKQAIELLKKEIFTAVLLDIRMPDMSGLEVLTKLKEEHESIPPVIIVSDSGEIGTVVKAIKLGAYDYIQKDFNLEILTQKINNALEKENLLKRVSFLSSEIEKEKGKFIYKSGVMEKIDKQISNYAKLGCDILLKGETGVGKDFVAREIFDRSNEYNEVFLPLPLASLNESLIESELFGFEKGAFTGADRKKYGKLELANKGTLYLPEISSISESVQLKLLQFMQYRTISRIGEGTNDTRDLRIRLIFATNEKLEELVNKNKMRSDFFYRIDSVSIEIPPLRERKEDIEPLSKYFVEKHSRQLLGKQLMLDCKAIAMLEQYNWPGNIRQLDHAMLKVVANLDERAEIIESTDLPRELLNNSKTPGSDDVVKGEYERAKREFRIRYFEELLKRSGNNYSKASEIAGISRNGLDKALKELGIK